MKQIFKKILVILIAFILIYSNGIITINAIANSIISFAAGTAENGGLEENNGNEVQGESQEEPQEETGTKAELGINVNELSTTLENDIQFTITLFTNSATYDLFKNPQFIIELPECIESISSIDAESITLLNNTIINNEENEEAIFSNLQINQQEVDSKKYIVLSIEGEQEDYTNSSMNNIQIVIPAKIKTSNLLPTTDAQINLYYSNENVTSYIKNSQLIPNYGEYNKNINFVAPTGILTETTINVEGESVKNYRNQSIPLVVSSKTNNNGWVKVIVVNNTGDDLENVKILGKSSLLQEITVNGEALVKYSEDEETEDDSWTEEYTAGAKSYLIELDEFPQGATMEYMYNVNVPEVENDTTFKEEFTILNKNDEKIVEKSNNIEVKTVHLDVQFEASVGKNKAVYPGQEFSYIITVENKGETTASEISIDATLPESVRLLQNNALTSWSDIELAPGESITKRIKVKASENILEETAIENQVEVNAKFLQESIVKCTNNVIKPISIDIQFAGNISKNSVTIENVEIGSVLEYGINLKNKASETKNITVIAELPENIDKETIGGSVLAQNEETGFWVPEEDAEITVDQNKITIPVQLLAGSEKYVSIYAIVDKYIDREVKTDIQVKFDGEEIMLEDISNAITPASISVESSEYKNDIIITEEEIELSEEDELSYIIKIKNTGETAEGIEVSAEVADILEVKSIEYSSFLSNISWDEEDLSNDFGISGERLAKNEEGILIVKAKLYQTLTETTDFLSEFKISGNYMEEEKIQFKNRIIVNEGTPDEPEIPDNPEIPDEPDTPNEPENPTIPETQYYNISGTAWLDDNENGQRDQNEKKLNNVKAILIKNDVIQKETLTDANGNYMFQNVLAGDYIVVFEYDQTKYKLTTSKKEGVADSLNSDAYEVNIDGMNLTRTDRLSVLSNLENIDIGLIKLEVFDLKLTKQISKITINNVEGTKVINYKNEEFAKIEIPSKAYVGTNLIIEYNIIIENIGEVAGYVYALADLIPEGTEFISEMNEDWYEFEGALYNISQTEEKILPGEQKEIKIILTKQIEEDAAISIKNKAEIVETFNEKLINESDLSNNISEAELLISVKTGYVKGYILLIITILTIIGIGIYIIKKKVLQ